MAQTFYIESDEEIISVIGRLRKSSSVENTFVFPKRALVLQSIINLRLFQREAEKLGKKIVLVSQDEVGKMLAEKAGIKTENYSEDSSQKTSHLELTSERTPSSGTLSQAAGQDKETMPHSNAIGSSDFYALQDKISRGEGISIVTPLEQQNISLRVRNTSPEKLTSLNSKRFNQALPARMMEVSPRGASTSLSSAPTSSLGEESVRLAEQHRGERLKNFYNGTVSSLPVARLRVEAKFVPQVVGKKAHLIFFIIGVVSLLSLASVTLFFLLPKAEVRVTPYRVVQMIDKEFDGRTDAAGFSENFIPVRLLEKEKEISLTITTTGKSGGTNQKARGTVVLSNNYSSDSQSLVATTRLETSDGKLFRLVSGVTVPGMTSTSGGKEAGAIEAQVIADESGAEYNIGATTFTIPGFKGGSKYEKFSATSTKAMTGGGSGGASDVAVVAKIDLDTALRQAKEKAREDFLNDVRDGLAPEEKILDEQIDIVPLVVPDMPSIGTVASAFDYKGVFRLSAFAFSEKSVKEKIEAGSEKNIQGILFRPISSNITYSDSSADFSQRVVRLKAHASVTMDSDVNFEKLRGMLLGKNEDGIKQTLESFPEIKNIQISFHPQWFVKSVPTSEGRVSILIEPGEDKQ